VGSNVIINDDRWSYGSSNLAMGLDDYRAMVVNHETGHWLGFGHRTCPGTGQLAYVMQQQSKGGTYLGACLPIGPGATLDVQVGGVEAIAINLTAVAPGTGGHATVFPTGSAAPDTSNLNFSAGQTVAGFALVQLGTGGRVSIRNVGGSTDYLIDVSGFVATS